MPTYVYECSECFSLWELVQGMRDEPNRFCSECDKESARRILQSPALTADATPNRTRNKVPPRRPNNNWEKNLNQELAEKMNIFYKDDLKKFNYKN